MKISGIWSIGGFWIRNCDGSDACVVVLWGFWRGVIMDWMWLSWMFLENGY